MNIIVLMYLHISPIVIVIAGVSLITGGGMNE